MSITCCNAHVDYALIRCLYLRIGAKSTSIWTGLSFWRRVSAPLLSSLDPRLANQGLAQVPIQTPSTGSAPKTAGKGRPMQRPGTLNLGATLLLALEWVIRPVPP